MNCHSNIIGVGWSDERVKALKSLWASGMSAGQIVREIGGVTRNGVLGKLHRLGLMGRYKPPAREKIGRRRTDLSVNRIKQLRRAETVSERQKGMAEREARAEERRADLASEAAPVLTPEEREQAVTLMQLSPRTCRWPLGDPGSGDFCFCGALPAPECPYCARHARMAYLPRSTAA